MATPNSTRLMRFVNLWRHLALRRDVDDIILELIGRFSLERLYAEADKETYQRLVSTLLVQLNAIFYVQRLSLPSDGQQPEPFLGLLGSWEVVVRSIEFILQVIADDSRDVLWEAKVRRDKRLAETLLSALRLLSLHPKTPPPQRIQECRDRLSKLHSFVERLYDSYPAPKPFLLSVCREVSNAMRTDPSPLALPAKLRYELPNLATELYPLPACLSSEYVSTITLHDDQANRWLSLYLALRDVAQFAVASVVQFTANGETREAHLQPALAKTRNAVLASLDKLRPPQPHSRVELAAEACNIFHIVLPDTPNPTRDNLLGPKGEDCEADALDSFCRSLFGRRVLQRVSDRQMMQNVAEVTKSISLLDDPSGQHNAALPRAYALNCRGCHIAGDTELANAESLEFPDPSKGPEISLPIDTKCVRCGEIVTLAREITLARTTWGLLKPLQPNADSISVERHLPDKFQLGPPKNETAPPLQSPYLNQTETPGYFFPGQQNQNHKPSPPAPGSPDSYAVASPTTPVAPPYPSIPPAARQRPESPQAESHPLERATSIGESVTDHDVKPDLGRNLGGNSVPVPSNNHHTRVGFEPIPLSKQKTHASSQVSFEKKSVFGLKKTKKDSLAPSVETSSISSNAYEQQKPEEISLKSLIDSSKSHGHKKPTVRVCLSSNSTHALLWTQALLHVWDVGTSPPTLTRTVPTESTCLKAAITKSYLAYVTGPREQKLTLRIINLAQIDSRAVEYHMPSSQWCTSLAISPLENQVAVGFEKSTVRFFQIGSPPDPGRSHRLHLRFHAECSSLCPPVDTLSFARDGMALVASTRSQKSGWIQAYMFRSPFQEFVEVPDCRYHVPLHESEDNGITSANIRPKRDGDEDLICITTWTQSGAPILVQPGAGHKVNIATTPSAHQRRLGNRIQTSAFSPSGKYLALVNEKGTLYEISKLNSSSMETQKLSTSKDLTAKSDSFGMAYMMVHDEETIVMVWAEQKARAYVKKVPLVRSGDIHYATPVGDAAHIPHPELSGQSPQPPANNRNSQPHGHSPDNELPSPMTPTVSAGKKLQNFFLAELPATDSSVYRRP